MSRDRDCNVNCCGSQVNGLRLVSKAAYTGAVIGVSALALTTEGYYRGNDPLYLPVLMGIATLVEAGIGYSAGSVARAKEDQALAERVYERGLLEGRREGYNSGYADGEAAQHRNDSLLEAASAPPAALAGVVVDGGQGEGVPLMAAAVAAANRGQGDRARGL